MRHSSFLTLVGIGLFVSGLTWAGPPDGEKLEVDPMVIEAPEDSTQPAEYMEEAAPAELLTFEEAVKVCFEDADIQTCIDEKTGQAVSEDLPAEDMPDTEEVPMDSDEPEEGYWDTETEPEE